MSIYKDVYERYFGFDEVSSNIIEMPVSELHALAKFEAPSRADDDFDTKLALFEPRYLDELPRLYELYNNWDDSKCDPIEVCKEGSFMMINNGFHRIIVASALGIKSIKVNLREGKFILQNHVKISELPKLIGMLRVFFATDSLAEMEKILADPKIDQDKIKHIFIGYRGMGD